MKNVFCLFLIMTLFLPATACSKKKIPVKKAAAGKVAPAEVRPEAKETAEAQTVIQEEYKYDARGRRDPFLSPVTVTKQKQIKKKGASPFESYDIAEVKLLAIAWDKNKYFALIRLPDKKTYTITEKMSLGLEGGKVEKITKDSLVIREYIKDYKGDIKPRDTILKLHKGEE
jgi:Tfp pilus assembly protein PilP